MFYWYVYNNKVFEALSYYEQLCNTFIRVYKIPIQYGRGRTCAFDEMSVAAIDLACNNLADKWVDKQKQ